MTDSTEIALSSTPKPSVIETTTATTPVRDLLFMTKAAPTTFHSWSRLPNELKIMVLTDYLVSSAPIGYLEHERYFSERLLPLLRSGNNQLATLGREIYYQDNTFCVYVPWKRVTSRWFEGRYILHRPNPAVAHMIRYLHVEADCELHHSFESMFLTNEYGWTHLFKPKSVSTQISKGRSDYDITTPTRWQQDFNNLLDLKVDLRMFVHWTADKGPRISPWDVERTKRFPAKAEILLKANTVQFEMCVGSIYDQVLVEPCDKFEDMLEGFAKMATKKSKH
ncbi:hypothetical protein P153DRAFT_434235 [Dothidotthia symphoricarpi CBS 119687]|uniref:Uncharacterized protein n=1 Tax=Dothidotthia symphoricarpi CBS 119687 TaxID=1392245 RepID=A0A6A6A1C4_9PLEO|nr:uncharacterized protein P153DRAFT_434235 [Dothidotthia symphoricarpi CBS 119687]KAF2125802.1 hypothetical protein P153DRAFT_434235 [Dothidotthia symphoricarpi CBS 119687]